MNTSYPAGCRDDFHALDLGAEHDALAAERFGAVADDLGMAHRHRVDADLLGARFEHLEHVVDRADAPAHGERDEHVPGDTAHGLEVDLALLGAGGDVVEDDLVDLVVVEPGRELFGRGDVDVVLELLRLRDPAVDHVEAGDQPLGQHRPSQAAKSARRRRPRRPLFSAWNCVATMLSCRDDRGELDAVLGATERVGGIGGVRVVGVDEVVVAAVGEPGGHRVGSRESHLVPADLGDALPVAEAADPPGEPAEAPRCSPPRCARRAPGARCRSRGTGRRPAVRAG